MYNYKSYIQTGLLSLFCSQYHHVITQQLFLFCSKLFCTCIHVHYKPVSSTTFSLFSLLAGFFIKVCTHHFLNDYIYIFILFILIIAECVRNKSQSRHVLGGLYHGSLTCMWITLLLLLDSWLLLLVGCVNIIHNPNNIIHNPNNIIHRCHM